MDKFILSNSRPLEKDGSLPSGANGLLLLAAKLHSIQAIVKASVNNVNLTDVEVFDVLSGIDDLLQPACRLCDGLDATQIAADISAETATPDDTAE